MQFHPNLSYVNGAINLARKLPLDIYDMFISETNSYDNENLRRLEHKTKNDKYKVGDFTRDFVLNIQKSTSKKLNFSFGDATIGARFPNIKEGQVVKVYCGNPHMEDGVPLDEFVPNNKIRIGLLDITTILHYYYKLSYRVFNADGTEDLEQEFYLITMFFDTETYRKITFEHRSDYILYIGRRVLLVGNNGTFTDSDFRKKIMYIENVDNELMENIGKLIVGSDGTYRLCWALKMFGKFYYSWKVKNERWKIWKREHKGRYSDVMMELEYMPDFGVEGIRAVERLRESLC